MASNTKTLANSIAWAQYFVGKRPLAVDATAEPALTSANTVIQVMLQPPFRWRWNRNTVSFSISAVGGSDYQQAVSDFGFIEKAYLTTAGGTVYEIPEIKQEMTKDAGTGRPSGIAPVLDDNAGNITFRVMPGIPDQTYTCTVIYQKQPVLMVGPSSVWPIPDRYGLTYNQGFLGLTYLFADDQKSAFLLQRFTASLLALSEGLSEQERNAFLDQWKFTIEMQRNQLRSGQGLSARTSG